uniref:Uncharacterized protein n=1 Tax=Arundo donax TaxID=35708 RepID=A0A0A9BCD7_ARUDO
MVPLHALLLTMKPKKNTRAIYTPSLLTTLIFFQDSGSKHQT